MTSSYPPSTPYRNDDEARALLVEKLQAEVDDLEAENAKLREENRRLTIIGQELMKEPPVKRSPFIDAELRRKIEESDREIDRLNALMFDTRRTFRMALLFVTAVATVPAFVRLFSILLYT